MAFRRTGSIGLRPEARVETGLLEVGREPPRAVDGGARGAGGALAGAPALGARGLGVVRRGRLGLQRGARRRGAQAVAVRLVLDGHRRGQLQDPPQGVAHAGCGRAVRRRTVPHRQVVVLQPSL